MLRISRMTDYGTIVLSQLNSENVTSADNISNNTNIAKPTVSKLLKAFTQKGLTISERGNHGGYSLARPSKDINVVEIIDAIEGPLAITKCSSNDSICDIENDCLTVNIWKDINERISSVLSDITLHDIKTSKKVSKITFHKKNELGL